MEGTLFHLNPPGLMKFHAIFEGVLEKQGGLKSYGSLTAPDMHTKMPHFGPYYQWDTYILELFSGCIEVLQWLKRHPTIRTHSLPVVQHLN